LLSSLPEKIRNDGFNIGTGDEISVLDLARKIWLLCGRKEPFEVKKSPGYPNDVKRRVPDVSKIRGLGWRPETDLNQGLSTTIQWLSSKLTPSARRIENET